MNTSRSRPRRRTPRTTARNVARLSPSAAELRLQATRWALAHGHPMQFDAISVILAAKSQDTSPVTCWTEDDIWRLWWLDLAEWCRRRGLDVPDELASSMTTLLTFLDHTGGFAPGSDTYELLTGALEGSGALGRDHTAAPAS